MSAESKSPEKSRIQKFHCQTRRALESQSELIWEIERLADAGIFENTSKILWSPRIRIGQEREFCVLVNSQNEGETSTGDEFIGLYVKKMKGPDCFVSFDVSLIDISGKKTLKGSYSNTFREDDNWGIENFMSRKQLLAEPKYIRNNRVTLSCEIKIWEEPKTSELSDKSLVEEPSPEKTSMTEAWRSFYEQKLDTDVVLKVGSGQFEAHKAVLVCRSPFFAAMLRHDLREKISSEVVLKDVDSDVFEDLLKFLYVDDFSGRGVGFVVKLLVAADRFDVLPLKSRCTAYLCNHLTPDNVLEVLQLPDPCRTEELDRKCLDLVDSEMLSAASAVRWLERMADLPDLLRLMKKIFVDERCQNGKD